MADSISTGKKGAKLGQHYQKSDWGGGGTRKSTCVEKIVYALTVSQEHFLEVLKLLLLNGLSRPFTTDVLEAHISRSLKP